MKILMTGYHNPHFTNTMVYRENAVRALAQDLISFDDRQYRLPGRLRQSVPALERWDLQRMNAQLLRTAETERPDICIVVGGHRILPETVERLVASGITTALWTSDVPINFDNILKAAPHYDHVFCAGTEAMDILQRQGRTRLVWLPFACDAEAHAAVELTDDDRRAYTHDVVFVGSYYPNRAHVLEGAADMDIRIWGPNWRRLVKTSPLIGKVRDARLAFQEWTKIYSAAKIVVVVHFEDPRVPCHQVSPKVFEAMACGSFVLTDKQKDLGLLFESGLHLGVYRGSVDLRHKIAYYLQHEDERAEIARRGCEDVRRQHTYQDRMARMLSVLTEYRTRKARV